MLCLNARVVVEDQTVRLGGTGKARYSVELLWREGASNELPFSSHL
jgi:hypothetical protein